MKKRRLLAMFLAFIITLGVLPLVPLSTVRADDPAVLTVSKDISWDPVLNPDDAKITITSDVPDLSDTKVLFIGTLCRYHTLTSDTIVKSLNSITKNADVDYFLLDAGTNDIHYRGHLDRGETTSDSFTLMDTNHNALGGITSLLNDLLIDKIDVVNSKTAKNSLSYDYDYIVFEFDGSRVAAGSSSTNSPVASELSAVASALQTNFYAKNKVIWITDGSDGTFDKNPGTGHTRISYVPTNRYSYANSLRHLSKADFRNLCAIMAPSYFLAEPDDWSKGTSTYYGNGSDDKTLPSSYELKFGERTVGPDYVNGKSPDYMVYPNTARQLWYNNASELEDFLYMAIEGATLKFEDSLKVAANMDIEKVTIQVQKKPVTSSSSWINIVEDFDVTNVTPTGTDGSRYVEDPSGCIKITKGNTDPSKNNQVLINVHDVKNQIGNIKVELSVHDDDEFVDSIEIKMDPNDPTKPLLDAEGNYQYEMNPNDGPVRVTAYQDGKSTDAIGEGKGAAAAPPVDVVLVESTVKNGTDNYDATSQMGQIKSTSPLKVRMPKGDMAVLTYTPKTDYGKPDIKIDGSSVTLNANGAASTDDYTITTDASTGVVTVLLKKVTKDTSVNVLFKDLAPVLKITKVVKSPTVTPVPAGSDIVYEIEVTNTGLTDAENVEITDTLDTSLVSFKSAGTSPAPVGSYDDSTKTVTWDSLTVPANGSVKLTLTVTVIKDFEGTNTITNTANGKYNGKNLDESDPANIGGIGRDITFTYTTEGTPAGYTKPADFTEVYGTTISPTNAAKATVSPVPAGYTFSGWYADSSYTTKFDFGKKITSSDYTITDADKVNIYGKFTSIKSFKVTKSVTFNGSSVEGGTVSPGSTVTYTVKVENTNPAATITDIEVVDTLPSGLTIDPNTISDGGVINGNKITWTILSLSAGSYKELTFNATVPSDIKVKTDYKNTAAVTTAEGENVDADDDVTFSTIPDKVKYTVGKTFSDTWDEHKTETVNVEIYQNGTAIPVSTSQKYIELTYSNQSANVFLDPYDNAGNPYTYVFKEIDPVTNKALDNNGIYNKNYKVTYTVDSSKNTTTIDNGYVITAKDLDFKKVADDVVKSGNEITYTLTVKNKRAYETATDIEVTDDLPDGVTVASVGGFTLSNESKATSNDNATDNSGVVTWTIEKLEPGCTATLVIKVIVDDSIDAAKLVNIADITKVGGSTYQPGEFPSPEAPTDVRTFTVTKEWADTVVSKDDHSAITVELYRSDDDTTPINTATLDKNNNWTYKWTGLKMYDANSQLYVYTVKETEDAAFTTKYDYSGNASGNTSAKITNTRKSYEINYAYVGDTPAGKATPTPVTKYSGEKYDAATKPTETNYVFDGWFTDSACTTQYTDGTTINDTTVPGGTLTLYGKWTRKLEVSYEYKGTVPTGAVPPASDYVLPNAKYDAAPTPSEKNYVFDGWFTDPGCTKAYTDGTEITKDTVLYGLWAKMPQVSYKYVGEDIPADVKVPDSENIDPRVGYDAAEKPSKLYYVFDGWFLDPDCKTRYTDGTKLTDDTVLYGNWKRDTAPVKPQPGNGPGPDPSLPVYPPESKPKQGDPVPVPPDPTYNGNDYRFGGWFADPDCTIPYTPTVLGPDGLNIYAKWDKNPTAYYTFNGKVPSGAKLPPNATMLPGTPYNAIMPEVPSGYKFDGWYLDPQMTIKFKDGMKIDADTYLYGQWIALDPVVPTGDTSCMGVWAMLTLVSCAGFVYLFGTKKRYVR